MERDCANSVRVFFISLIFYQGETERLDEGGVFIIPTHQPDEPTVLLGISFPSS